MMAYGDEHEERKGRRASRRYLAPWWFQRDLKSVSDDWLGPVEPKGRRVPVWELEKWSIMNELMICFLKTPSVPGQYLMVQT